MSLDHIIARLQTLEAAAQVRNASNSPVVINARSGLVHLVVGEPSNQRSGRPVAVSAAGVQSHMSVSLTHVGPRWIAEFVVPVVPRATHRPNPVLEHMAAVSLVQECTVPVTHLTYKKEGWVGGSSMCFP